jgi:heterodisulfide reductase subunit C
MQIVSQIAFIILFIAAVVLFTRNIRRIIRNIRMGAGKWPDNNKSERWRRVLLNAFGQKKMFKRPIPAVLHFFVYAGFVIINIEILEIIIDGLFGTHRVFNPLLGNIYSPFISFFEFLALAVLVSCIIFLIRRNIIRVKRLNMYELTRWPNLDANLILITEVLLMIAFLTMNGADQVLQSRNYGHYHYTGNLLVSQLLVPMLDGVSNGGLVIIERVCWWFHIIGILAFLNYLVVSKHLHILFAFPNTYYSKVSPMSKIRNMPEVEKEVKLMIDPNAAVENSDAGDAPASFGAKDVTQLLKTDLLGAYSCTECGRCTAVCPANITGKLLSPRKIMMDTRDRCHDLGVGIEKNGPEFQDGKSLLGDYITHEEIMACTTCQACVEACPVNINPLSIIVQLRRYVIMEEAKAPANWNVMFNNIENNFAPWQFSPSDRFNWAQDES